jgi:hypothetical protein
MLRPVGMRPLQIELDGDKQESEDGSGRGGDGDIEGGLGHLGLLPQTATRVCSGL